MALKTINLVKMARQLDSYALAPSMAGDREGAAIASAMAAIVSARAEGSRGLGARVDAVLEQLAAELAAELDA